MKVYYTVMTNTTPTFWPSFSYWAFCLKVVFTQKEHRSVRDLARKRMFLVQHKTTNMLILKSFLQRCCAIRLSANTIRKLTVGTLEEYLKEEYLIFTAQASLDRITFFFDRSLLRISLGLQW